MKPEDRHPTNPPKHASKHPHDEGHTAHVESKHDSPPMGSSPPHPHDFAPSLGRIVLVGVKNARGDFFIRPAVMVQIGPVRVDDEDQDQVGLHVFHAPADGPSKDNYVVGHLRDPSKPWEPGDWEWPQRQ